MANEERGEVELVSGTTSYTLALTMNAICDMQTRTKKTYGELIRGMLSLDFVALRDIVYTTLKKHHGQEFSDVEKVGDLIDRLEYGPVTAIEALTKLFELNAEKVKVETANPQLAQV